MPGDPASDANVPEVKSWPVDAVTVLNSLCGYSAFAFFCLTLPLFLPFAFILPGGRRRWIAAAMRFAMRRVFNVTPTVSWRCDGDLNALADARVVVSNHEGMLDIIAACGLPGSRTLLAKTWVFRAFPLGVAARAAGLYNSDALTPEDYQEGAPMTLADPHVGIFVFPEGSRSRDGAVHRFRPGAFVLAKHLDVPVVPVVMAGSRLGIRPGSMWIHPTRIHTRVLAPMRPAAEESHRQFAERVRTLVVNERHRLLVELLRQGHLDRHRRHRSYGFTAPLRQAVCDEENSNAWRVLLELPRSEGAWLFLGCGWSTLPLIVRMLYAEAAIHLVENDEWRLFVARYQWVESADQVVADVAELPASLGIVTVVCEWAADAPGRAAALQAVITDAVTTVVVRTPATPPTGFSTSPGAVQGWAVCRRQSATDT
ncbi:MAG: 1-acyl-sn-glycerol-3-phosphate acyltransferase [Planctomycetes bacterium]|nr:1-acyl-sn-glycerol-3-phosphate acyltransferase [Planctomycetota bacterium]